MAQGTALPGVSHYIHQILASITDDEERWKAIGTPPLDERTGTYRWTETSAQKRAGQTTREPTTVRQKVAAIHDLAQDREVAAAVATDLLRRPEVARTAMSDEVARQFVNRAQIENDREAAEPARRTARPAMERVQHTLGFVDLVGACATFVAAGGRTIPNLGGRPFTDDERVAILRNVERVRATADWIANAANGNPSMDEGLAALLRDQP